MSRKNLVTSLSVTAFAALSLVICNFSYSFGEGISEVNQSLNTSDIQKDTVGREGTVDVSSDSYLNVRTGPGTNFEIIGKLNTGAKITPLEEKLGWYKINFEGREAWVNGYYVAGLSNIATPNVYGEVVVPANENLSMRVGAGYDNPIEGALSPGSRVKVLDKQDGWYKVEVIGYKRPLWVNGAFLKLIDSPLEDPPAVSEEPAYVNIGPNYHLNLRSGPATDKPILMELSDRAQVKIVGVSGCWYKIKAADGTIGYCHSSFITKGTPLAVQPTGTLPSSTTPGTTTTTTSPTGERNILETFELPADAGGVTPEIASKILSGLGYDRFTDYGRALSIFQSANFGNWNAGKKFTRGELDASTKASLLQQAKWYKEALAKYPQGVISKDDAAFNNWVSAAAPEIKNIPAGLTDASGKALSQETLVHGILKQESGKYHWKNRKVIMSPVGAVGFMQIMPFNCGWAGNIYDPEQNLKAGVHYINEMLAKSNAEWKTFSDTPSDLLAKALAAYNGGPGRAAFKSSSWNEIVRTNAIPRESIGYAIKIRKSMGVAISTEEENWLAGRL